MEQTRKRQNVVRKRGGRLAPSWMVALTAGLASALFGCATGAPYWAYTGDIKSSNLAGCPDVPKNLDAFWVFDYGTLRRTDRQIVAYFHVAEPPTTLLLDFKLPSGGEGAGRWNVKTRDGTLRAWLVRTPAAVYKQYLASGLDERIDLGKPEYAVDKAALVHVADGQNGPGADGVAFALSGRGSISTNRDNITGIELDLESVEPMPLYQDYLEYLTGESVEALRATAGNPAFRPDFRQRIAQDSADVIAEARRCAARARPARASVKGEFRGYWDRHWRK